MANVELQSGLTWRVLFAMIVAILLFVPLNIYSYFMLGQIQASVAVFFITIIFSELSRMYQKRLSRQEVLLLYYAAGWSGAAMPIYYNIIFRSYFVNSPFMEAYTISGKSMADFIPAWLVPPPAAGAHALRSLFQHEFLLPVAVWAGWSLIVLLLSISLSLLATYIYVERLDYPFPLAMVDTSVSMFLSERPKEYLKYFLMFFGVGALFGAIAYLPYSFGFAFIPIPFIDFNWVIEEILPGALFGIVTVLSSYFMGLVVPFGQASYAFIISIIIWVILNSLFVTSFPNIFPDWAREYSKGMGMIAVQYRSYLRVWFIPQIGFILGMSAFLILFKTGKPLAAALREAFRGDSRSIQESRVMRGLPSLRSIILLWLGAATLSVIYFRVFVSEVGLAMPIIYVFVFSLFYALCLSAFQGETGQLPGNIPGFTWHALLYMTPYQGYSGFIFQPALSDGYAPAWFCQQIKAGSIIGARPKDFLIVWIAGSLLAQLAGLVALDFFWRMAPIPSSVYPFTVYGALQTAYNDSMIVSRQLNVSLGILVISALILFVGLAAGNFIYSAIGAAFPFVGIVLGTYLPPYSTIPIIVGALVSRFIAPRFFGGSERWRKIVGYVVAGELAGEGLMLMLNVIIALINKSAWLWPW